MTAIMKFFREVITWLAMLTIFCASAMKFPSASYSTRNGELETILEELRKELNINSKSNNIKNEIPIPNSYVADDDIKERANFESVGDYPSAKINVNPLLSALLSKNDNYNSFNVEKRQGSWDYDYGLGGGRFGKRAFGDYSLGGGRFGRDVGHVQQLESEEVVDFDDPTLE